MVMGAVRRQRRGWVGSLARLLFGVAGLVALVVAFLSAVWVWAGPRIAEALLREKAADAGLRLRAEAAGFGSGGVFLDIAEVGAASWRLRDVRVELPWSALVPPDMAGAVTVRAGGLRVDAGAAEAETERGAAGPALTPERVAGFVETGLGRMAEALGAIPLRRIDFAVVRGRIAIGGGAAPFRLRGDFFGEAGGARRLAVRLRGPFARVRAVCLAAPGAPARAALRIRGERAGAFSRWLGAAVRGDGGVAGPWLANAAVRPFDGQGTWLAFSAYARRDTDGAVGGAVLGRLAKWEVSGPEWSASFGGASAGIVLDGAETGGWRGHLELPLERARIGTSVIRGGGVRGRYADGAVSVSAESEADLLALTAETADVFPLGRTRRSVDLGWAVSGLSAGWLRGAGAAIPAGLDFAVSGEGSGTVALEGGALADFRLRGSGSVADGEWAERSLAGAVPNLRFSLERGDGDTLGGEVRIEGARFSMAGVTLDSLRFLGRLESGPAVRVERLRGDVLGGAVRVEPFVARLAPPGAEARVRLEEVALSSVAALVPRFAGEAEGRVSGVLDVTYRDGAVRVADGRLELAENGAARLAYPAEDLLTEGMREGTPAFQQYRRAEKALEDLALNRLRIDLFPGNDPTRPLRVTIAGESTQEGLRVPVEFTLNVNVDNADGLLELLRKLREGDLSIN